MCRIVSKLVSSPIRQCALAVRLVRSPAKNGTTCLTTDSSGREIPTITPDISAPRHGGTSCSWSKIGKKEIKLLDRHRTEKIRFAGFFFPTFANTAKRPVVSKRVQLGRSCEQKSVRS